MGTYEKQQEEKHKRTLVTHRLTNTLFVLQFRHKEVCYGHKVHQARNNRYGGVVIYNGIRYTIWHLNNADTFFGGEMIISDCSDSVCKFSIQSWYDSHICDVDGELSIQNGFAKYKTTKYVYDSKTDTENYVPVGIVFNVLSQNKLNLRYVNTDSDNAFCGMNATIEGVWIKQ